MKKRELAHMNDVTLAPNYFLCVVVSLVAGLNAQCKILLTTFLMHVHLEIVKALKVLLLSKLQITVTTYSCYTHY